MANEKGNETTKEDDTYYFFKYNGKLMKIIFDDIIYVRAEQEYSYIFTKDDKFLVSMHLKKMQEILPESDFLRIHRSYIVAKDKITSILGNAVQLKDSIELPIAKSNKANLLSSLKIKRNSNK